MPLIEVWEGKPIESLSPKEMLEVIRYLMEQMPQNNYTGMGIAIAVTPI